LDKEREIDVFDVALLGVSLMTIFSYFYFLKEKKKKKKKKKIKMV